MYPGATHVQSSHVCSICLNERAQNHKRIHKHPHRVYIILHTGSMISNHARTLKHTSSQTYVHICMNQIISLTRKLHIIHTQMHRHILYTRAHVGSFFRGMSTAEGVTDVSSDCHAPGDSGKWEQWKEKKKEIGGSLPFCGGVKEMWVQAKEWKVKMKARGEQSIPWHL